MLNEADHVESLVEDIASQDVEVPVEVIVADGRSTDDSVAILQEAAQRAGIDLTVLDNAERRVSSGLNRCIRQASGDVIVRMDCHTRYPSDYLRRCAEALVETGAWNVGGRILPLGRTPMERAVACAMDSAFGGIGWRPAAANGGRREVANVPYGAFRPEAFAAAGLYDESLLRNQDHDLNVRIRAAGGRIVMDPEIRIHYVPRGSLRAVARQYFQYGVWKMAVTRKHGRALNVRSVMSPVFVASLAGLSAASFAFPLARPLLAAELGAYLLCAVAFGIAAIRRRRESLVLLPRVLAVFPAFHVAHGLGGIRALVHLPTIRHKGEALDEEPRDPIGLALERELSGQLQTPSGEPLSERGVVGESKDRSDKRVKV
jgi:GT2 family glycosyltransferase